MSARDAEAPEAAAMAPRLVDMHCHLDRMIDAERVADGAARRGIAIFDTTTSPAGAELAQATLRRFGNVRVGVGLHPWLIASGDIGEEEAARAALLAGRSRFVGEVGIDLGPRHADAAREQIAAFEWIVEACASSHVDGRVMSIHAVRSCELVLDVLERFGLASTAACIFHWFSGTGPELARARDAGCYFSVSHRMLQSRRGRAWAAQIPVDQLLLETDAPPVLDTAFGADELESELDQTLDMLAELRATDRDELARRLADTSARLLGLPRTGATR